MEMIAEARKMKTLFSGWLTAQSFTLSKGDIENDNSEQISGVDEECTCPKVM